MWTWVTSLFFPLSFLKYKSRIIAVPSSKNLWRLSAAVCVKCSSWLLTSTQEMFANQKLVIPGLIFLGGPLSGQRRHTAPREGGDIRAGEIEMTWWSPGNHAVEEGGSMRAPLTWVWLGPNILRRYCQMSTHCQNTRICSAPTQKNSAGKGPARGVLCNNKCCFARSSRNSEVAGDAQKCRRTMPLSIGFWIFCHCLNSDLC